ncbi:MAG: putative O-sialoglycoprotein endopeptidase [Candidatus Xenolissoclinum pacificiensis L6]|uniref:tRNA N6-adenosine threonylcarbamoyltransferase n=1 Tax=Candidatus Xenolissoclinum pacificiensis L6 TaxID=1401685 RepID=W2V0V1_9RICK|nr:MAG: putative O-sialoglycoprotein endopeptidase [Candidatus Xenolissoclinum pacificiensis L6]
MVIFGIEASCDETAVAIIDDSGHILSEAIFSQDHNMFGGVYPEYAARNHVLSLRPMIGKVLQDAKVSWKDINLIAFTGGPGLIGGLIVATMLAKSLSLITGIPMVPVNHLEGHALMVTMFLDITMPFLLLLISGGHCQILVVEDVGKYMQIGTTIDDSIGECFDKVAREMQLSYPGGPEIEQYALRGNRKAFSFPKPLLTKSKYDFSFSGLKTSVINTIHSCQSNDSQYKEDISASFEYTIVQILLDRIQNSIQKSQELYGDRDLNTLVVSGGVAANQYIRQSLTDQLDIKCVYPPIKYCTDNAVMIAWAGYQNYIRNNCTCDLFFTPRSRWPL